MWRKLWFNEDLTQKVNKVVQSGLGRLDHGDGLIKPVRNDMSTSPNWIFCGNTVASRDCFLWHSIMFDFFGFVPKFCRLNCYKVVVRVRNFMEAYQFINLMNASAVINADCCSIHGKCGIDARYYTDSHFNGFVYCDGLEDAQERYETIRKLVDENLEDGENIPIIIKRSCTEFELKYGATDNEFWNTFTEEDESFQKHLEDIFVGFWTSVAQPDWLKNKVFYQWCKWANTFGDKTWVEVFGKDFITMKAVTYHNQNPLPQKEKENGTGENTDLSGKKKRAK